MSEVTYEKNGDVAVIRIDDGKANALSPARIGQIQGALARTVGDAGAVVITGRPGRLSAGFDLKVLMAGPEPARELFHAGGELFMRIYEHPLPVVAACTGHAIAGGALLLGASDVRIGADGDFKIGLNEIAIGVPLPIFAHALAADRLDPRQLVRATLGATLYPPREAAEVGWLDRVVPMDDLLEVALAEARQLATLPREPYALSKLTIRRATITHVRATMESDLQEIGARLGLG
jgi:enoyl-CoA hydratase